MIGLALLVGHLVGDFIFQNDYVAARKRNDSWVCVQHCAWYTLAIYIMCMPVSAFSIWFYAWIFASHFVIDRYGIARKFMRFGHEGFATGALAPWSVIVVDNTFHLVCAFYGAGVAGAV